jgi:lipocalin
VLVLGLLLGGGVDQDVDARQDAATGLQQLEGTWFEIARFGPWWHRRCVSDTTVDVVRRSETRAVIRSRCRTASGVELHDGVLDASAPDGRWRARFAPGLFAWVPAVWSDLWVVGHDGGWHWVLVGDRSRTRLAVWSRTIAIDEAALARAVARARQAGFDVQRLTTMRHDVDARRTTG